MRDDGSSTSCWHDSCWVLTHNLLAIAVRHSLWTMEEPLLHSATLILYHTHPLSIYLTLTLHLVPAGDAPARLCTMLGGTCCLNHNSSRTVLQNPLP